MNLKMAVTCVVRLATVRKDSDIFSNATTHLRGAESLWVVILLVTQYSERYAILIKFFKSYMGM